MENVVYIEDLPAYKEAPRYVRKFASRLLEFNEDEILIEIDQHKFYGKRGISSNINHAYDDFQLLGTELSYTFTYLEQIIELSLQFYKNTSNYYRLYAYTKSNGITGMAFSINLTTNMLKDGIHRLSNKIKFSERIIADSEVAELIRQRKQQVICDVLCDYGYEITDEHDVILGEFHSINLDGKFVHTDLQQFVYDMIIISLIKGHYMGNKGYNFKFLPTLNG